MTITGFVGKNPKESSSIMASTISGYKALNYREKKKHINKCLTNAKTGHKLQPGYMLKRNKSHQGCDVPTCTIQNIHLLLKSLSF